MSDTNYDVSIDLNVKDHASTVFDKVAQSATSLGDNLTKVGSGFTLMSGALDALSSGAMWAAGGLAAGAKFGAALVGKAAIAIGTNESMLEAKGIQLGAVIAAATSTPFEKAKAASEGLFAQFRTDAIASAGESKDFIDIASGLAGPILGAGKSMKVLHDMTQGVMNTAPALGISFQEAGSGVTQMLQGVAGLEQPLFRAMVAIPGLGIKTSKQFNALSPEKRIAITAKALQNPAFVEAAKAYGASFGGLASTVSDQMKTIGGIIGGPTFELVKRSLQSVTDDMTGMLKGGQFRKDLTLMGELVAARIENMSENLGRIFPSLTKGAEGFSGVVLSVVDNGLGKLELGTEWLANHWVDIKDGAKELAHWIADAAERADSMIKAIGGGDFVKGAERIAEMMTANKAAQIAAPTVGTIGTMGSGISGIVKMMFGGIGGEATAATGAAVTAGTAGTAEAGTAGTAGVAAIGGPELVAGLVMMLPLIGQIGATFALLYGAIDSAMTVLAPLGDLIDSTGKNLEARFTILQSSFGSMEDGLSKLYASAQPFLAIIGVPFVLAFNDAERVLSGVVQAVSWAFDLIGKLTDKISTKLDQFAVILGLPKGGAGAPGTPYKVADQDPDPKPFDPHANAEAAAGALLGGFLGANKNKPNDLGKGSGGQTITIKWDLGDGDEDAIYVRSKKAFLDTVTNAKATPRSTPLRGA